MSESAIERIGVVGCGLMGSGIAEVCARAGREVCVVETGPAAATARPQQVIGLHFFNPVPALPLVELVPSLLTGDDTTRRTRTFAADVLGKDVVHAADRAGFIVNALLVPYLLDAVRMVGSGAASADDVDRGMRLGCAHPLGPLALADLIGLDTTRSIAESLYEEFREPRYAPPPLLARMVDAGLLGRKSGRGFHHYRCEVTLRRTAGGGDAGRRTGRAGRARRGHRHRHRPGEHSRGQG